MAKKYGFKHIVWCIQIDLAKLDGWILIAVRLPFTKLSLARMLEDGCIRKIDATIELSFPCRFFQVGRVENTDLLLAMEASSPTSNINIFKMDTFNGYKFI